MKRLLLAATAATLAFAGWVLLGLPSRSEVRALAREAPGRTGVMRQREKEAEKASRKPRHEQTWIPVSRVSRHLVHAVLASEDQKFFGHEGVDWEAIQKSIEENRAQRRLVRGGSTITQQLAKNLFFTTHRSPVRKLREVMVARWLEQDLSKSRILELYLNVIEWGDGVYGAEAAARRYYAKSASALTPAEAAGLAAMIPNPRRINPRVNGPRHARATRRVMWLMSGAGYLGRSGIGREPPPPPEPEPEEEGDEGPEPVEADEEAASAAPAPSGPAGGAAPPDLPSREAPPADPPPPATEPTPVASPPGGPSNVPPSTL